MITYYTTIKLIHLLGMAAWFGAALVITLMGRSSLNAKNESVSDHILEILTRIEMPTSFFIPLTGILMMIDQSHWLTVGWLHIKILMGFLAIGFTHISRAKLVKIREGNPQALASFLRMRGLTLISLLTVIIIVGYN